MKTINPTSFYRLLSKNDARLIDQQITRLSLNGMGLNRSAHLLTDGRVIVDEQPFTGPRLTRIGTPDEFLAAYPEYTTTLTALLQEETRPA